MRYRRVSYRYTLLFAPGGLQPLGGAASGGLGVQLAQPVWRPSADVYETEYTIEVVVELPGVEPEQVEVLLFEDALVVEGDRRVQPADAPGFYHAAEVRQGHYRAEVPVECLVDGENVDARYDRGLLRITLHKRAVAPPGRADQDAALIAPANSEEAR